MKLYHARGRPKLVDKAVALDGAWGMSVKDGPTTASKAATALTKTRVKGKYIKSGNYKMPKKATISKVTAETFTAPQPETLSGDSLTQPSSYPSQHELERPASSMSYRSKPPAQNYQNHQSRPLSIHSEPPLPGEHQDPFYYPPSYPHSTSQIKRPQELYSAPSTTPLATVFLTMDLICARVSDESQVLWGYHPHDISHKSLYSIIANEDQGKLRNLLSLIKDAVFSSTPSNTSQHPSRLTFLDSTSQVFYQNRPNIMSCMAPGSSEYTDVIRVCHADGGSDLFSIRMYVGGGLGTDLQRGLSIEHAYIVCVMARHSSPLSNNYSPSIDRASQEDHTSAYNKQPQTEPTNISESGRKIALPPIVTGPISSSASFASPSIPSPLSSNSSNGRLIGLFSSSTPLSSPSSSSAPYTAPLLKPSSHSTSLPSLRTGPLHTARWLYDSEPYSAPGHSGHGPSSHRLPTMFSDPFRAVSAPMGGFGVSKYLSRPESTSSFPSVRRHQLPLPMPSSIQSSSSMSLLQGPRSDMINQNPRSLQRDLSSSSFGASFASTSPPSSMKRPLADIADSQDRNRDIDNRHQDHHHHHQNQSVRSGLPVSSSLPQSMNGNAPSSSLSLTSTSCPPYQPGIKLDLQTMPPDHPAIDPSSGGVCPIVHGSQQRERVQQQIRLQVSQVERDQDHEHGYRHGRDGESGSNNSRGYFNHPGSGSGRHHSLSPGDHHGHGGSCFSPQNEERNDGSYNGNGIVNPFSTGPSSPTETYSSHRSSHSLRRTSSIGRLPFVNRGAKGPLSAGICLSGACGPVCRCSAEDEETRAVKAMDAARKRMSVHSLLC
ncbi:hypothetical protein BX616_000442 [Lobosporangium transversale]|nr:hypothetical protein BX616_000442 [Lobosporangium transversale]